MSALERASVQGDISDFASLLAGKTGYQKVLIGLLYKMCVLPHFTIIRSFLS